MKKRSLLKNLHPSNVAHYSMKQLYLSSLLSAYSERFIKFAVPKTRSHTNQIKYSLKCDVSRFFRFFFRQIITLKGIDGTTGHTLYVYSVQITHV